MQPIFFQQTHNQHCIYNVRNQVKIMTRKVITIEKMNISCILCPEYQVMKQQEQQRQHHCQFLFYRKSFIQKMIEHSYIGSKKYTNNKRM